VITDRGTFVINALNALSWGNLYAHQESIFPRVDQAAIKHYGLAEQGAPVSIELELDPGSGKTSRAQMQNQFTKTQLDCGNDRLVCNGNRRRVDGKTNCAVYLNEIA